MLIALHYMLELCGLWFFWDRIQYCSATSQSESTLEPVPTWHKQSDFWFTLHKYKSSKQPKTFFQQTQNSNPIWLQLQQRHLTPDPVGGSRSPDKKSSPCTPLLHPDAKLRSAGYLRTGQFVLRYSRDAKNYHMMLNESLIVRMVVCFEKVIIFKAAHLWIEWLAMLCSSSNLRSLLKS